VIPYSIWVSDASLVAQEIIAPVEVIPEEDMDETMGAVISEEVYVTLIEVSLILFVVSVARAVIVLEPLTKVKGMLQEEVPEAAWKDPELIFTSTFDKATLSEAIPETVTEELLKD